MVNSIALYVFYLFRSCMCRRSSSQFPFIYFFPLFILMSGFGYGFSAEIPPPPLGVADAEVILNWTDKRLSEIESSTATLVGGAIIEKAIEHVEHYMQRLAVTSPPMYQWITVGRKRVSFGRIDTDEFHLGVPVLRAMAVRFHALGGDIYIQDMIVVQQSGARLPVRLDRWLYSEMPKREMLYFPHPLDVDKIIMNARNKWSEPARLVLDLGIAEKPDYPREVMSLCATAREHLHKGRFSAARIALHSARSRLRDFGNEKP